MGYEATSTDAAKGVPLGTRARAFAAVLRSRISASDAVADAWRAFCWTRIGVFVVALFASLSATGGLTAANARRFDIPVLTHPFGGVGDLLLSPLARWDSVWFLNIADSGYQDPGSARVAFFPLYPLLSRGLGELGGGSRGATLVAAYVVSLATLLAALVLLHKLTTLELGARAGGPAVMLLCVFPASLFLGAPYSESLFLLASVGAFYAARTGSWAWAGASAAAASGTRSAGILLVLPLVTLYLYGPRPGTRSEPAGKGWRRLTPAYPIRPDLAWIALAPAGLGAYALYLGIDHGDALAFSSVQELWSRQFAGPFVGAWDGLVAAFQGVRQLASGSREAVFFAPAGGDPFRVASINIMLFASLAFAVVATVGVLRRLPLAYGLYVVTALALPLSYPVTPQPLMSLPRFLVVLFPIFMWLGWACAHRGSVERVAAASALGLGLFTVQYATWYFIA